MHGILRVLEHIPSRRLSGGAAGLLLGAAALLLFPHGAFGKGTAESGARPDPINTEWVFCVTALDVSALPPSRRIIGEVLQAKLVNSLKAVDYRIRVFPEYTYYEGAAWSLARHEAGKKLADKRNERDLLLYRGADGWSYRRSLEAVDKEILRLEAELKKAEALIPEIGSKPEFKFSSENEQGTFPEAPKPGGEKRFCISQKADAFLTGKVSEFHGRIYLVLRIYAFYADSYIYDDSDIFSPEDINLAADGIAGRLIAAISGTEPAAVQITAAPEHAMALINHSYAGRGKTEILERSPGPAEVSVYAEDHAPQTVSLELTAGELAELSIQLTPLGESIFNVNLPPASRGALYRGALYSGEAPQTLGLFLNQYEYIQVNTPDGETARTVLFGGGEPDRINTVSLRLAAPKEEGAVLSARRKFYGAYGRFWLILPAAYILQGLSTTVINTYTTTANPELYDKALTIYYASIGALVVAGGFLAESLIREVVYMVTSTKHEPTLAKTPKR